MSSVGPEDWIFISLSSPALVAFLVAAYHLSAVWRLQVLQDVSPRPLAVAGLLVWPRLLRSNEQGLDAEGRERFRALQKRIFMAVVFAFLYVFVVFTSALLF